MKTRQNAKHFSFFIVNLSFARLRRASYSGDDAPVGNIRSHTEHGNEEAGGRWYLAGDGPGEQVVAGI